MDTTLLRDNLTLADALKHQGDRAPRRSRRDKKTQERRLIILCPECNHHALEYTPSTGNFHCWKCGIYGHFSDVEDPEKKQRRQHPAASPPKEGEVPIHVEDYMPLDEKDTVSCVDLYAGTDEELETDPVLSIGLRAVQKAVRYYLRKMDIPLKVALDARIGVAERFITTKEDEKAGAKGMLRPCIAFRNYVDGYLVNIKYRCIGVKKVAVTIFGENRYYLQFDKGFDQQSAFTPCAPYGIDVLNPAHGQRHETLYICEGEKDCLTLRTLGLHPAISVASGANTDLARSFEAFRTWLEPLRRIIVVGDQDEKGRQLARKLVDFFDAQDVYVAHWDQRQCGKDISDVHHKMGADVARTVVSQAQLSQTEDVCEYTGKADMDLIADEALGLGDEGYDLQLGELMNQVFRITDMGGLIIVSGVPGSGKSDWIDFFAATQMARHDDHVCYCSFEVPDKHRHLRKLTQTWIGATPTTSLTREQLYPYIQAVTDHVTHLNLRHSRPTYQRVLHRAEAVLARHPNMRYLIIDPYLYLSMSIGHNITETEAIKQMLTSVQDWAHLHHVWVIIVAHPRKMTTRDGSDELEEINFYTLSGSANWANVADFLMTIKRVVRNGVSYTVFDMLKVRFQEICHPGTVYLSRHPISMRYDARPTAEDCMKQGRTDDFPWKINQLTINS